MAVAESGSSATTNDFGFGSGFGSSSGFSIDNTGSSMVNTSSSSSMNNADFGTGSSSSMDNTDFGTGSSINNTDSMESL